jgi:hypothetical protein
MNDDTSLASAKKSGTRFVPTVPLFANLIRRHRHYHGQLHHRPATFSLSQAAKRSRLQEKKWGSLTLEIRNWYLLENV